MKAILLESELVKIFGWVFNRLMFSIYVLDKSCVNNLEII